MKINDTFHGFAEAFDNELMYKTLKDVVEGKVVEVPTYDFVTHSRYIHTSAACNQEAPTELLPLTWCVFAG